MNKVDKLIVGGGIANTFLAAAGHNVGKSLIEADMIGIAKGLAGAFERLRRSTSRCPRTWSSQRSFLQTLKLT